VKEPTFSTIGERSICEIAVLYYSRLINSDNHRILDLRGKDLAGITKELWRKPPVRTTPGYLTPPQLDWANVKDQWNGLKGRRTALGLNGADEEAARPKKGELVWTKAIEETRRFLARRVGLKEFPSTGIGEDNEDGTIRCLVTPSLATLTADVFDCVVCDEAVRMKSSDSFVGLGVRKLRPAYRLVLTGTPIKNRLGDIFWLAWWAYDGTDSDKTEFEKIHSVEEQNITKEKEFFAETGVRKIFKKRTAQICNLHLEDARPHLYPPPQMRHWAGTRDQDLCADEGEDGHRPAGRLSVPCSEQTRAFHLWRRDGTPRRCRLSGKPTATTADSVIGGGVG